MLVTLPPFLLVLASLASLIVLPSLLASLASLIALPISLLVARARLREQEHGAEEIISSVEESLYDEPRYLHMS